MYEIIKNKIVIIFSKFKDLETSSCGIFVKAGSRYEDKNIKGASHFIEHLLFKGSKKYSNKEIKREIEGRGGLLNAFTSYEFLGYYAHFLSKNIKITLDILLDMVFNPLFKKEDIEKERTVILEELKMYYDLPASRSLMLLNKLLWQNHPLGEEIIGDFDTIEKIKREDLLNFKNTFYHPKNIIISLTGSLDIKDIVKFIDKRIDTKKTIDKKIITKPPKPLYGINIELENKKISQIHLSIGFRGLSYLSKDRFTIELLNIILGANTSSRLFENIREEKALCYDISTDIKKFKDTGAFIIHLGLDKKNLKVALENILKELVRIKKTVSEKELTRAKDYFIGQITMGLETPQGRMFYLSENYITQEKIYTLNDIKDKINPINTKDISSLANKIFSFKNMCVSCVGDIEKNAKDEMEDLIKKFIK